MINSSFKYILTTLLYTGEILLSKTSKKQIHPKEMWWVNLTDDTVGTETQKNRPCLVVKVHTQTNIVTVIPCTTNLDASRFSHTYMIKKNSANKLPYDSIALIFQIRSLHFSRFLNKQGKISNQKWEIVLNQLRDYLDIE